ncbi:MAG: hypothetical protein ABIF85_02550 [Nanoarchaeota archaeon]|nr:hypothetical protein [Nanoarchaeota archaeon]MBU4299678.1 hypothetical protein [Nanoarchaeota archaeon]MBU4451515.1 hypothetical protein [Nanoarchaeota archaeon]MCG2723965.1 hypothetical protein [archaeon]
MVKISEEEQKLLENGWIKTWLLFEVVAVKKEVAESALKEHIGKLKKEAAIKVIDENFTSIDLVEPAEHLKAQGITETWSQIVEIIVCAKDFEALMNMVVTYAPTAVEIMAPAKITLDMRSAQNALATVADMIHKFAAAGIGGMLISGK